MFGCFRIAVILAALSNPAVAGVLEDVQSAGALHCGVDTAVPGFSARKTADGMVGMAEEFCRAMAAAVIGDGSKVVFSVLAADEQIESLQSGEIDVLVAAFPISSQREMAEGLLFAGPLYVDETGAAYGPSVRQSDDQWYLAVAALRNFLIKAEPPSTNNVLLVASGGKDMGDRVLATTGHYGDIFARSFGADKRRGKNQRVENGGWLWTPAP
jgi:Bacterial extracellular solute-binding proteins, family 3